MDEILKLNIDDAKILSNYLAGDYHLIDRNKLNYLIENIQIFVHDYNELYEDED